ncbi:hypothetical protein [Roseiarcus sp.]|uniref:hypothetical protein n=1 Tax=Roseiarcus sp. TaxID=1969460 RepID=UPI003F99793D
MPHAPARSTFADIGGGLDPGSVAEAAIEFACHLAAKSGLDERDCIALVAAEATATLTACGGASLLRTLAFLRRVAPARAAVLARANDLGEEPPPLDRSAALMGFRDVASNRVN